MLQFDESGPHFLFTLFIYDRSAAACSIEFITLMGAPLVSVQFRWVEVIKLKMWLLYQKSIWQTKSWFKLAVGIFGWDSIAQVYPRRIPRDFNTGRHGLMWFFWELAWFITIQHVSLVPRTASLYRHWTRILRSRINIWFSKLELANFNINLSILEGWNADLLHRFWNLSVQLIKVKCFL